VSLLSTMHWGRIIVAAVLSEVGVVAVLLAAIAVYKLMISPGRSDAEYGNLGERIGYYVAPTAGFVTTLALAFWAVRGVQSSGIASGILVGVISVAITTPFFLTAKPEHRLMYGVAFGLRIAAGYLGAVLARSI
jgi:hypothetical protein